MRKEIFINYWIGEEPCPPSPILDEMPAYVDIAPLAFVGIDDSYHLDFGFLTKRFSIPQLRQSIKNIRKKGTKVLLSINDQKLGSIPDDHRRHFIDNVCANVAAWDVDGIDFDYEPPQPGSTLAPLIQALRRALPPGSVFSAPIYSPWIGFPLLLKEVASVVDWLSTMDYTPYPGYRTTIRLCQRYAAIIGGWHKLVIGMSCMSPPKNFTPLDDVVKLSAFAPEAGVNKGGAMLYNFSYDVKTRTRSSDHAWTSTIHRYLP